MKCLLSLVTIGCLVALALAAPAEDPKLPAYGGKEYLKQQADLLKLLKYLHQPYWNAELHEFGVNYKIWEDYDSYDDVEKVKVFVDFYKHKRLLPKNAVFSLYDAEHLEQTKVIFDALFHAKTYDTMFKFGAWLRFNINEKMFMYLAALVIAHKPGFDYHNMPPPYEVCPYQFINAETIKLAHRYKMQGFYGVELKDGVKEVIIPVNYTGWYMHMNPDQKVSYFTEDVGLNAFYYNFNIDYPHWMEGKPYGLDKDRRGEFYIIMHHEIYARYYLERLSNDLGHVPTFNWRVPFAAGYHPALMYVNGKQFPTRPNYYNLYSEGNHKFVQEAEDRERRVRDIIDQGFFAYDGKTVNLSRPEDVDTLGTLLQGNPDSYGLHHNFHDHIVPSFLENFASAARDPLFYSFYKNLLANYWKFMSHMEPYHYDEIAFPGVKIVDSHVDKIETFFDHFDVDITNAIEIEPDTTPVVGAVTETHFKPDQYFVKARTMRLNHKPFDYKLTVKSDAKKTAAVRVYIGPKYDEYGSYISFEENRKNFVLLDIFQYELIAGENVITRNSDSQYLYYSKPQTSYFQLYKYLLQAEKGEIEYPKFLHEGHCSFPKNLMIPKGKKGGMTYQFFFTVTPFVAPKLPMGSTFDMTTSCGVGSGSRFFEDRAMLYPIDRPIDTKYYYVPNMHFEDVEIFFNADESAARFY